MSLPLYKTPKSTWLVALGLAGVLGACTATGDEVRPPDDAFYFPTGMALSPDESTVFVINANSDLRFASGSIVAVDTAAVDALIEPWITSGNAPDGCEPDVLSPFTLVCDETPALIPEASVRVGNFGTELTIQEQDSGGFRLFAAVRGDPSLTWIDYDGRSADCGGNESHQLCDDAHRLINMRGDADLPRLLEEPFGLYADPSGYVMLTHLTTGAVTLADAPTDGSPPVLADALVGLFVANQFGIRGAVGAAGRAPGMPENQVYVTSSTEARVQLVNVVRPSGGGLPRVSPGDFFFLTAVGPSNDGRGITFSEDGDRAYIVNRVPPLLHVIDTSTGPDGRAENRFIGGVEICSEASTLSRLNTDRGERVYVACFRAGQIWVIDPEGATVESIVDVGRGPSTILGVPSRNRLYVTNFLEDTIAVIDTTPGSSTENRVVLRLGRTRQSESD